MRPSTLGTGPARVGVSKAVAVVVLAVIVVAAGGLAALYGRGTIGATSSTSQSTSPSASSVSSTSTSVSSTSSTGPASVSTSTAGSAPGPSSGSSTSTSNLGFSLAITEMAADVVGPGLNHLEDNETYAVSTDDEILLGVAGSSFDVQFDLVYSNCANDCPSHVANVTTDTPGFSVVDSNPGFPIPIDNPAGAGLGQVEFHFTVGVQSPQAPYNGELTLIATT